MNKIVPALVGFLALSLLIAVNPNTMAQVSDEQPNSDQPNSAESAKVPVETLSQDNNSGRAPSTSKGTAIEPGSYNPSEEISDDLSVSFPVDI